VQWCVMLKYLAVFSAILRNIALFLVFRLGYRVSWCVMLKYFAIFCSILRNVRLFCGNSLEVGL